MLGRISQSQLLEQSIFQTLRTRHKLSFYQKDRVSEIDFIIDGTTALEVKMSVSRQDISNLKKRAESNKLANYFVISHQFNKEKKVILTTDL